MIAHVLAAPRRAWLDDWTIAAWLTGPRSSSPDRLDLYRMRSRSPDHTAAHVLAVELAEEPTDAGRRLFGSRVLPARPG